MAAQIGQPSTHHIGRKHARKGQQGPYAQVDSANQNDKRHAEGQQRVGTDLTQDVPHVGCGEKGLRKQAHDCHERGQTNKNADVLLEPGQETPAELFYEGI